MRHVDHISEADSDNDKCKLLNFQVPAIDFAGGGTHTANALKQAQVCPIPKFLWANNFFCHWKCAQKFCRIFYRRPVDIVKKSFVSSRMASQMAKTRYRLHRNSKRKMWPSSRLELSRAILPNWINFQASRTTNTVFYWTLFHSLKVWLAKRFTRVFINCLNKMANFCLLASIMFIIVVYRFVDVKMSFTLFFFFK